MNTYLKLAYDLGVQRARVKFAQHTSIQHQQKTPTWGLGGKTPTGFQAPPPATAQAGAPPTTPTSPGSGPQKTAPKPGPAPATATQHTITHAQVPHTQLAGQQQANRSGIIPPATTRAKGDVADVVARTSGAPF